MRFGKSLKSEIRRAARCDHRSFGDIGWSDQRKRFECLICGCRMDPADQPPWIFRLCLIITAAATIAVTAVTAHQHL